MVFPQRAARARNQSVFSDILDRIIMDVTGWTEKAKNLLGAIKKKAWGGFSFAAITEIIPRLIEKLTFLTNRLPGHIPEGKRRPVLFCLGGMLTLFIILAISVLAGTPGKPGKNEAPAMAAGPFIPAEDLFIPAEPDFVPKFLLEREPRSYWSVEDIRPYWKSPGTSEYWRGEVKSAVDKIMEGVP
jgi:hypothetical protein